MYRPRRKARYMPANRLVQNKMLKNLWHNGGRPYMLVNALVSFPGDLFVAPMLDVAKSVLSVPTQQFG
jgi:hypothetical protein